ncbi:PREDICTED: MLO-like protein 12 [Fragaria vesca subsp. vesca]|uniref:MLO-like protein 12 n=1 Tax=Fragaria vesca subsp. vesca TaxID=101020 RepID=UPI0002C2F891|nr:PREDICTED: MLO-like protein 12 [Fragaria vesca subsp. vesca]
MADRREGLEDAPTWAVSVFALFIFILSFIIDDGIHRLTKFLKGRRRKSLNRALKKFKTEMMQLGFISLLLTLSEVPISNICVSQVLAISFLPCKYPPDSPNVSSATQLPASNTSSSKEVATKDYCEAKGLVSLVSREGILQLNILISVLAVFHVLYCILTMFLGMAKMRKWNKWEEETRTLSYQILNDPRRFQHTNQTPFVKRHLKIWTKHPLLLWPVCFARQFGGSISKVDYMTLRNGFIAANIKEGSSFNFLNFLSRAFDDDFEQVVGIKFWVWISSILFILFNAHVFYNYYWLPFIPLLIVLLVGTKLQVVITKMCAESCKENPVIRGSFVVKLNDDLFWFGKPNWLLHLLQFVLIQNSFQLAFLTWSWIEYGHNSCFNRRTKDVIIKIAMGIVVQLICGYVTLPLYALVTQMGSGMKKAVFTELVVDGLKNWHKNARRRLSKNGSTTSRKSSNSAQLYSTDDASVTDSECSYKNPKPTIVRSSSSTSEIIQDQVPPGLTSYTECSYKTPKPTITRSSSTSEIIEEQAPTDLTTKSETTSLPTREITREEENPNIMNKVLYDGEISFGSSWKLKLESVSKRMKWGNHFNN